MKRCLGVVLLLLLFVSARADLKIHIQSPFRDDPSMRDFFPHIVGGAGANYIPVFGVNSETIMSEEGNDWFSFTWTGKNTEDFQEWMDFEFNFCPNTNDNNYNNNNCKLWEEGGKIKIVYFFGTDTEIWLYTSTTGGSYTKSFIAPGSKVVWFKSPWGNRALPQMYFGSDSLLMRYTDDADRCGWFYAAISPDMIAKNPSQMVYFTRFMAPWLSVPEKDSVMSLAESFQSMDSVFIDGTSSLPFIASSSVSVGECFDSTYRLHVYHPWRTNTTFRDSAFYITVDYISGVEQPTALLPDEYEYWHHIDFTEVQIESSNWKSENAKVQIFRGANEWPRHEYFSQDNRPAIKDLFPVGVYETWLFASTDMNRIDLVYYPLEMKVVRLLSPWDNMSPMMIVADDTVKMGPISKDTCGWYQGKFYKHTDDWSVYFRQSFGMEHYAGNGIVEEGKMVDSLISLDSMMQKQDVVWLYPYPVSNSAPRDSSAFPGRLGICPSMKISALVVDWAGESYADEFDVDFGNIYNGNAYTEVSYLDSTGALKTNQRCEGHVLGMVRDTLVNGLPARVDSLAYPWGQCSAAHEIEKWFVPVPVASDVKGNIYTNGVCRDIDLTLDEEGFWLADITNEEGNCNDSIHPGFYPIDDLEYLDDAKTVKNPKFDWDISGCKHNYGFAMKVSAQFKYVRGQYFEFRGDDDVWVFIDNRLVVDIGGCHSPVEGAVKLDTMGLVEGREYPFHIFFSERNATGSNFKMRTSINLQTQKTYYPVEIPRIDGKIEYSILQLLMDEAISCDVSSTSKIDTVFAQSLFVLYDGVGYLPSEGESLDPGVHYGGISISENMAGFMIDTNAIVASRALPSGVYRLKFSLASDLSQSSEVVFTVPEYPPSEIAFVDSAGEVIRDNNGKIVTDLNDVSLGEFAFVMYPVDVVLLYQGFNVDTVPVTLHLKSTDSLVFFNQNNESVDTVKTDVTGHAKFFVMGTADVVSGAFTVSGGGLANSLIWRNINLVKPPVPNALAGSIFDRNGDGVPDSLGIPFAEKLIEDIPDTLEWFFGDTVGHRFVSRENIASLVRSDSVISIDGPALLDKVFTGDKQKEYQGLFRYHYSHVDKKNGEVVPFDLSTTIQDKIGPIIENASIIPQSESFSVMTLNLSEAVNYDNQLSNMIVMFKRGANEFSNVVVSEVQHKKSSSKLEFYFYLGEGMMVPTVGDSVRLVPGVLPDLNGNTPHLYNPWIRLSGESRMEVDVPGLVYIGSSLKTKGTKDGVVFVSVPTDYKTVKDVVRARGLPGHFVMYDLSELAMSYVLSAPEGANRDSLLANIRVEWQVDYFSNLGQYVNGNSGYVYCNDATIFNVNPYKPKNCLDNPGYMFFEWNARSKNGRLVGTGAYISKFKLKIRTGNEIIGKEEDSYTIGIKRLK